MCNFLHIDYKAIPVKGYGYKLFTKDGNPIVYSLNYRETDGWIKWDRDMVRPWHINGGIPTDYVSERMGFCFFMSLREAKRAKKLWCNPCWIARIQYNRGLGRHTEDKFCEESTIEMALCKEFRILQKIHMEV